MTREQDKREPLDRVAAARRAQKFLRAMQQGGHEAFERAWREEFPPDPESQPSGEKPPPQAIESD